MHIFPVKTLTIVFCVLPHNVQGDLIKKERPEWKDEAMMEKYSRTIPVTFDIKWCSGISDDIVSR